MYQPPMGLLKGLCKYLDYFPVRHNGGQDCKHYKEKAKIKENEDVL